MFFLNLVSSKGFSQEFAPIGETWHYTVANSAGSNSVLDSAEYFKCVCIKDSLYFGKLARMVQCKGYRFNNFNPTGPSYHFFYQNGDTIFRYFVPQFRYIRFQYLNTAVNDTLKFESTFTTSTDQLLTFKVDTILYETFNNEMIKKVELKWLDNPDNYDYHDSPGINYRIYYEGIGGRFSFIPFNAFNEIFVDIVPIRCYESPLTNLIKFGSLDCEYRLTSSIVDNNTFDILKVHPNPAEDVLTIELNATGNKTVEITNMNGQVVEKLNFSETKNQVSISAFPAGVYFVKVQNGSAKRFVKI